MTHLVLEKHQYLQKFTLFIENSYRIGIYDKFTIGKHVFERKLEKMILCVLLLSFEGGWSPEGGNPLKLTTNSNFQNHIIWMKNLP